MPGPSASASVRPSWNDLHTALALTWMAYAYFYVLRKALGTVKSALRDELALSEPRLASLDTAFLSAYSAGLYVSGCLVDALAPRTVLAVGLLSAASAAALLPAVVPSAVGGGGEGTLAWIPAYAVWFFHGLAQSVGHPAIQRILGRRLKGNKWSGLYLGIWTTSQTVGGIVGNLSGGFFLRSVGWEAALRSPAYAAPVVVLVLRMTGWASLEVEDVEKSKVHAEDEDMEDGPSATRKRRRCPLPPISAQTFRRVLQGGSLPPQVYVAAGAAFFVKFVRYALLFWLPYYNWAVLGYGASKAAVHASVFELGGFFGSMAIGPISDRLKGVGARKRALPSSVLMLAGSGMLGIICPLVESSGAFSATGRDLAVAAAIFLVGISVDGPESVVTGAMCNDLCEECGLGASVGRVVGLVNGTGILGALLAGPAVTMWARRCGSWRAVLPFLGAVSLLGAGALLPLCGLSGPFRKLPPRGRRLAAAASAIGVVLVLAVWLLGSGVCAPRPGDASVAGAGGAPLAARLPLAATPSEVQAAADVAVTARLSDAEFSDIGVQAAAAAADGGSPE